MGFKKALRENIWLKVLLSGSSGSGKSYTGLTLATGIAKKMNKRIAFLDSENGRSKLYAGEFDFDVMVMGEGNKSGEPTIDDYKPEKYIEAIDTAVENGYGVIILDSISHEWKWCLDSVSKMTGNQYTNWGKITPRHNKFVEKILNSPIHIIYTARGKDEYIIEEENGKKVPKKVGVGYEQRGNDLEFNSVLAMSIDQKTHVADITKDNTHLFEDKYEVMTIKHGEKLYDWANSDERTSDDIQEIKITSAEEIAKEMSGEDSVKDVKTPVGVFSDEIPQEIENISKLCEALISGGVDKEDLIKIIQKHNNDKKNYKTCSDINALRAMKEELEGVVI